MAEVRKNSKKVKYDITEEIETKVVTEKKVKKNTKKVKTKTTEKKEENNKSLWVRFRIFCHGVASEFKKVNWPTRYDMVKYSIATIVFVVFLAVFFYLIDVIFAAILGLVK
jgi:preprotein translocase SecE subunit